MARPILLLATCVVFVGCSGSIGSVNYRQNEDIPADLRNEIHALNDTVTRALLAQDPEPILKLFPDEGTKQPGFEDQVRGTVQELGKFLSGGDVRVFHEFDATFTKVGPYLWALVSDINDGFIVHVNAVRERLVVSLLAARAEHEERLIGLIYGRDGDAWRLWSFRVGRYLVTGKSAFEWAREAGQLHERGLTIPAQLRFTVAKSILRPLPYMQYVKESTVTEIGEAIERDVAKLPKFPLQLTELPSKPAVYAISPMFDQGRIVALVMYVTQLELSESVLTPEVEAISGQLEEKLPGLCVESELVAYRAFREAPSDPAKNYPYQALVHDCNGSNGRAP